MSIWSTFTSISTGGLSTVYKWGAIAFVALSLLVAVGCKGYSMGKATAALEIAQFTAKKNAEETTLLGLNVITNTKLVEEVVTKTVTIHDHGVTNVQAATTLVPDHQFLSLGWLHTHDAAAAGDAVDPTSAHDGTPSTTQANTGLSTVVSNYATCNEVRTQLIGLQDWINETNSNIAAANKHH